MKKLLSILMLLVAIVTGAKADGYPTYQLIEDAAINSADFHTAGTLEDGTEISGFSKYVLMTGNVTGTTSLCENTKYIAYDVKSTKTVFTVRVYNSNSSAKNLLIHDCKEVLNSGSKATTSMETVSVVSKTATEEATTKTYTTENTGKATIYFSVSSTNIHFYQIIAEEQGDALTNTTPGVGYSLNLKYGRIAAKTGLASIFDGMEFCPSSDYKPTNNSELKLKTFGTNYVKFTLAERAALKLKVTSGVKYTLGTAKDVAGEVEYGGSAGTYTTVLEAGTWFINPISGNTSDFKIENISFDPVYAVNFEAGEGGSGTMTSKYYVEDQTVTVPTCSFTHETKVFDKWSVEGVEGKTEAVADDEFTMPSNTVTLTALWRTAAAKHSVTYDINGGTGDTPTQVDVEENANFTVAGTDGFTAPAGQKFSTWNDGTNNYAPGADYTMGTSDVTLTAQYVDVYAVAKTTPENGSIAVSATEAAEGETITLTATPDFRYALDSWNVYKTGDTETKVTVTGNQFTMPAYAVTVDATFAADPNKQVLYVTGSGSVSNDDRLYSALSEDYTVTVAKYDASISPLTVTSFDLVVLHESIGGGNYNASLVAAAKSGNVPVLNTKSFFYTSARWNWGTPNAGNKELGCTMNAAYSNIADHPIFEGITPGFISVVTGLSTTDPDKAMQPVGTITEGKEGYVLATVLNASSGNGAAIHELTPAQRGVGSAKYLLISLHSECFNKMTSDGIKLFKNAAAYLMSNNTWTPTLATTNITLNAKGFATYSKSNDFTFSGAKAYKMALDETAKTITGTEVTGKIQAGAGILLKGEANANVTITGATWATALESNSLKGSTTANGATAAKPTYCYVLSGDTFMNYSGESLTANKAYIQAGSNLANSLDIVFEGDPTAVEAIAETKANAEAPVKVIKNGKLYIGNYNVAGQQIK